ncbi:LOW QUALITY PROTEIN: coiled-coil and C2 domain-containing protein 1A [Cottoperca gobio]|uniref:Coiled-coil and C2 domain-containing protein 1B n=1 Tax=Cottoperca gobio TaxID=56716 RepID=A0A6J2PM88_COTGO|nr:LOW QUALITY PROTEIN: coiled-coil and C2 domain-containing protein 1A [Cottoperca gobio]
MSRSRNPPPRGQGAARAKQMGLLLDLSPDGGVDDGGNDEDLEAELLNLLGGGGGRSQEKKGEGRAPVPMADIERMAALCMKDLDDEDMGGDDLDDDDEDLLAELNEVLGDNEEQTPAPTPPAITPTAPKVSVTSHPSSPAAPGGATGLESCLLERIEMYKTAVSNAKAAGETSKVRRYDRGLKTLQSMLTSVRKGKPVNEEEIPPPVVLGGKANISAESEPNKERKLPEPTLTPSPPTNQKPLREAAPTAPNAKLLHLTVPQKPAAAITPETPAISPLTPGQPNAQHSELKQAVLSRQREYKIAAIHAKQRGDIDLAKQHYVTARKLDIVVEALDRDEPADLSSLPPPPGDVIAEHSAPPPPQSSSKPAAPTAPAPPQVANADLPAPSSLGEALQQRMDIYKSAAEGAKSKGDDRKARMHQRIVKQYQDSIRAHKAGRTVTLSDLPVPPGCPPLQGSEGGQQNFMGVLETAMKIANQDADAEDEEEDGQREAAKPATRPPAQKAKSPAPQPPGGSSALKLGSKAQHQVDFLLLRRQAFLRAALRSKQMKDMTGAAQHLRHAKGLDPMVTAAKSGLPVDITKIPSAPVSEEDYSLARSRTSPLSPRSSEQYHGLMDLLRKQHEKCLGYSQQLIQVGNVAEALKFEKLVEECMKYIEILKSAHAKGQPVPKCRTEERTLNTVKIHSGLTPNDLILFIIKGINLPAPSGVSPNDLDASVKFEFPFPSAEEAQRDKTGTVKSTNNPEFKENFKLNINRAQRGFKRVVQSKGVKFEIVHKGGLFKTDRVVGTAQLKLEALEKHSDIREIIEVMDGRKATGGKLEVRVKIREPLSGVDLQPVTEKWLVLDPVSSLSPPERQRERAPSPRSKPRHEASSRSSHPNNSPPQYKLHSFSILNYDRERQERKIAEYRKVGRDPPSDLVHQHKEFTHRLQWQKAQLERGSSTLLTEYENVLRRAVQGYAESVKKYSNQGNRDAAKDALGRLKLVENELESLKRKRTG